MAPFIRSSELSGDEEFLGTLDDENYNWPIAKPFTTPESEPGAEA